MPFVLSHFLGTLLDAEHCVKEKEKINRNNKDIAFALLVDTQ